jgi:spore coat polysaccharide biosynthesis protein SpsF
MKGSENMSVVCIMQARTGSTRLPEKVLKKIKNKTILEHDIDRVLKAKTVDELVIATTEKDEDNVIVDIAKNCSVGYYRGSEDNVLSRYYFAAKKYDAEIVIRITSDCPLIDPQIIDDMVNEFLKLRKNENIDYLSNKVKMTFPRGLDVEVFTFDALEKTFLEATQKFEKEHVTPYIYLNPKKFKIKNYENDTDYSMFRWTLDTEEDFLFIKKIYDHLYNENKMFLFRDVLKYVQENPEISKLNEHVRQKDLNE